MTNAEGTLRVQRREAAIQVRLLNWSGTGCELESGASVSVGTVAIVRVEFGGQELDEGVVVVRCQAIEGAGNVYRIGAHFVANVFPLGASLRRVMFREASRFAGSPAVADRGRSAEEFAAPSHGRRGE